MRSLKTHRMVAGMVFPVLTVLAVTVVMVQTSGHSALAQQAGGPGQPASAAPTAPKGAYELLTPANSTLLLIDHQPQMAFGVQSHDRGLILNNTVGLAKAAKAFKVPTILTTVAAQTFSGPLFPEIQAVFPEQKPIDRTTMNAWEDERVRNVVRQTGRPKLIIAGLWTEVCVVLPTIEATKAGYEVYVVADASGGTSKEAHELALARMIQAGAIPVTWQQVMLEWQRDWARQETYAAVNDIVRQHSGAYGMGINYAKTMLGAGGEGQATKADEGTAFGTRVKIPKQSQ
jgi:nicotinamidase-related amidase